MTRKDFELIADTVRRMPLERHTKELVACEFAARLTATNERFDVYRFMVACMKSVD